MAEEGEVKGFHLLDLLRLKAADNKEISRCADKDDVEVMEKFLAEEDEKQEEGMK